ncbi:MAG: type IV pilus biogenesis/stability protein PilW [Gallionellaceae bacterium]|jgi:type IV pilus assembly protein PilF
MKLILAVLFGLLLTACSSSGDKGRDAQQEAQVDAEASARIHTELAAVYYGQKQYAVALDELKQALNMNSNYAPAYGVRGLVYMALHEDKKADDDFEHSLDLDSNDSGTRNNYGWFLCQRGREKESMQQFLEAVKNPLYATPEKAFLNAGLCSSKFGKLKDAETYLKNALSRQPNMKEALVGMAELSFAKADYAGAKAYFLRLSRNGADLSAADLLLAVRVERKLGDRNAEASYKLQLRKRFPESREARLITSGG